MAKTYKQKMDDLRLKSLRIIEDRLNSPNLFDQFYFAAHFMSLQSANDLQQLAPNEPDALDAEEIVEIKKEQ